MSFGRQQQHTELPRWKRAFSALRDIFATPNGSPLTKDLKAHQVWLDSDGVDGTRLVLTGDHRGIDLSGETLDKADLGGANFREAKLIKTSFKEADVTGATFWDADLTDADLTGVIGLRAPANGAAHPLGGTNLSGATLPDEITQFAALDVVAELSKNAGKAFVTLITADAFMQIIVAKTTDLQLLTDSGTAKIPLIDADIPTIMLFWLGPLVLLILYVSFHLSLQRSWEMLAGLPAIFPDGAPLTQRSYPWLLTDMVRSEFPFLFVKAQNRPLGMTQYLLFTFLAYLLVPLTLFPFWARYLCRHEWTVTGMHIGYAGFFLCAMLTFFHQARRTLRRPQQLQRKDRDILIPSALAGVAWAGLILLLSLYTIKWGIPRDRWAEDRGRLGFYSPQYWVPRALERIGYSPFANFEDAELSVKPDGWQDTDDPKKVSKPVHLKDADLRYANLHKAFLVGADLSGTHLDQADLREANLREAYLYATHLEGANLVSAKLGGAYLVGAHLEGAHLRLQLLAGEHLEGAYLNQAYLSGANLEGAYLKGAHLEGAYLGVMHMSGTDPDRAYLGGMRLNEADLLLSDLGPARLGGTRLKGAHLEGASLEGAHLEEANLEEANLDGASLKGIFWDNRTIWPDGKKHGPKDIYLKQYPNMIFVPEAKSAPRSSPTARNAKKTLKTP